MVLLHQRTINVLFDIRIMHALILFRRFSLCVNISDHLVPRSHQIETLALLPAQPAWKSTHPIQAPLRVKSLEETHPIQILEAPLSFANSLSSPDLKRPKPQDFPPSFADNELTFLQPLVYCENTHLDHQRN